VPRLSYEIVDVFTDRPFTGNPLAVVFGAEDLDTGQLQALAREFNLSETAFVLPPSVREATYRIRIFTPERELPFAGHPSVGAAVTQVRRGLVPAGDLVQECGAGLLPVVVPDATTGTLTGGTPTLGPELDPRPLLAAVGLTMADHVAPAPRLASCGLPFPCLRVTDDAVGRAVLTVGATDLDHLALFSWDEATATATARVFAPGAGVCEDPATGSAALALGAWLVGAGLFPADGTWAYTIHQGRELHRPSILLGVVEAANGRAVRATVSGQVVPVASGEIAIPLCED
jgi:trans-2,3-dihydro-3-hydroxyanthranilate isomerase